MLPHTERLPSENFLMEYVPGNFYAVPDRPSNRLPEALSGAGEGIRTPDPLITNQMLYRLSYASSLDPLCSSKHKKTPEFFPPLGTK